MTSGYGIFFRRPSKFVIHSTLCRTDCS